MRSYKLTPATAFAVGTLGIALFSIMDAVMKGLTLGIGVYNALFWRQLAGLLLTGTLYVAARSPWPKPAVLKLHVARGSVSAVMGVLFFWGLARVPMAQAISLSFIAPLIAIALAALVLGERVPRIAILASVMAFGGVLTILIGQAQAALGHEAFLGALAVLASAICYAVNLILMRQQSQVATPVEAAFWQTLVVTTALGLAAPWFLVVPDSAHWPALGMGALLATGSLLLLSWAYAHGEASYLAPTEYTSFIWASTLGWLVFGEHLSPWTLGGAALIILGCLVAARSRPNPIPEPELAP